MLSVLYLRMGILSLIPVLASCGGSEIMSASGPNSANIGKPALSGDRTPYLYGGDIFVADNNRSEFPHGDISVYGTSNTPIARIGGSDTQIDNPYGIGVDTVGKIWVSGFGNPSCKSCYIGYVLRFAPGSDGNVSPAAKIEGPYSTVSAGIPYSVAVDSSDNVLVGTEANVVSYPYGIVATFAPGAHGDKPPTRYFESTNLLYPTGMSFSSTGNLYVANGLAARKAGLMVFEKNDSGHVSPLYTLTPPKNGSGSVDWFATGVAVDYDGSTCRTITVGGWYVGGGGSSGPWAGYNGRINIWNECPPSGTSDPDAHIGSAVLMQPEAVALDSNGNIYVADPQANAVFEFSADASGNSTPIRSITGGHPYGVAILFRARRPLGFAPC